MAPRGKRGATDDGDGPQAFHELGVRGRKTGLVLRDTGERDEYGMQPLEDLLSSPEPAPPNGRDPSTDDNDSGSDDMDLETSIGPGPRTVLKERQSFQMPIPRSRSPIKTNLKSPARKNPYLERVSSPTRGSTTEEVEPTVTRKLDFGNSQGRGKGKANGISRSHREEDEEEDEADNTQDTVVRHPEEEDDDDNEDLLNESLQMVADMGGDTPEPEPEAPPAEEEEEEEPTPVIQKAAAKKKGGRGRPAKAAPKSVPEDPPEEPSTIEKPAPSKGPGRRGRPAKKDTKQKESEPEPEPPKASRKRPSEDISLAEHSMGSEEEDNNEPEEPAPKSKKQKMVQKKSPKAAPAKAPPGPKVTAKSATKSATKAVAKTTAPKAAAPKATTPKPEPKPRGRPGRKPKAAETEADDVGDTSMAAVQRGPPMPKARGLVSVRRDDDVMKMTRSGRQSFKPLDWWRGEEAVREDEEMQDMFGKERFNLPSIKEVKRVPQELPPSKRAPRSKGRPKGTPQKAQHVQEDLEDWEVDPGTMTGEVILWEPEHEHQPPADDEPVEVMEERVAVSSEAIKTRDTRDATFRFAKTLTTPFMGAGIVDLPPGAEKRPKNSRKMHMVFFVHYGKVLVTVNDTQFRITAGGMWFVPRGNYYSITNDYDNPCRIFFSQACEMSAGQGFDPDMSQNSTLALG